MFHLVVLHQLKCASLVQSEQNVSTDKRLIVIQKCLLFTAHSLDVTIEVVNYLASDAAYLLYFVDFGLFEKGLVLGEHGLNRCFEYVGFFFWLGLGRDGGLFHGLSLLFLFLLRDFALDRVDDLSEFVADSHSKDFIYVVRAID